MFQSISVKLLALFILLGFSADALAQTQPAPAVPADLANLLGQVEQASQSTVNDLKSLRIDKWKADSSTKQQSQANADSVQRNISSALPGLIQQVRTTPASVSAQFKLYRNMNALYDVLSGLTESVGAFGAKNEFQPLSTDLASVDNVRRALADRLATITAQQDSELTRFRTAAAQAAAAAAAAPPPPPRKIVVDDAPAKSTKKKKPAASSAAQAATKPATPSTQPKPPQ